MQFQLSKVVWLYVHICPGLSCQGSLCLLCCGSSIWWAILAAEPSTIAWTASRATLTGLTLADAQVGQMAMCQSISIDLKGMWICKLFFSEICWLSWVRHFRVSAGTQADSTWVCVAQLHCFPIQRIRVFRHLMNLVPRFSAQPLLIADAAIDCRCSRCGKTGLAMLCSCHFWDCWKKKCGKQLQSPCLPTLKRAAQ